MMHEQTLDSAKPAQAANYLPYAALAVGILGLSLSPMFVRWAGAPGPVAGFYRVTIAALVMALPVLARARHEADGAPLKRSLSRRHLLLALLAGLFFSGDLATWNTAVMITSAANATLLGNTAPVWVSLAALVLFKERLGWVFWGGLGLAMAGAILILGSDFLAHPAVGVGDLLAMTTGFFYGAFLLTTERARAGLSAAVTWWVAACASSVALLVISLVLRQPLVGFTPLGYLNLVAAALVSQVAGYLAINYALGHLPASVVSPTLLAQPVVTALLAVPLLGEAIGWTQVAGGLMVLAGIWFVNQHRKTPAAAAPALAPNNNAAS